MVAPAIIAALISALGSVGGGLLNRKKSDETSTQGRQRETIDDLLASLNGEGKYSDLLQFDEEAFNKSYVEPAKARFQNQTAPQIQQSFISSGQQRGTGLDDTLTRAGVDLDQELNQQFLGFQQGAKNRQLDVLRSVLNQGAGAQTSESWGSAAAGSAAGYLSSPSFQESLKQLIDMLNQPKTATAPSTLPTGYAS